MHGVPRAGGHTVGWAGPGALQAQLAGSGLSGCPGCWHPLYSSSCRPSTSLPELWATVWCVSSRQPSPEPPPSACCQLAALPGLLSSRSHGGPGVWPHPPETPGRGMAPSNARRRCVKASLSALYKVVGHAAVLLTAAGRCYYPLPARRSRWRTPGPGIIVLLDGKLPLPAGPFA